MGPLAFGVNAGGTDMSVHDRGESVGIGERTVGGTTGEEDFGVTARRSGMAEVVEEGLAHGRRQGQQTVFALLQGWEEDFVFLPAKMLQPKRTDMAAPDPIRVQHLENGIIASAGRGAPIGGFEDFLWLFVCEPSRDRSSLVGPQGRHGRIEGLFEVSAIKAEPKKRAESRLHRTPCCPTLLLPILQEEPLDLFDAQARQFLRCGFRTK